MEGLILNKDSKYVTYLEPIFDALGPIAENLNWRISYMEIGRTYSFETHPRNNFDYWISGKDLASELRNHPNNQWIWGLLQGYSSNISYEEIVEEPLVDIKVGSRHGKPVIYRISAQNMANEGYEFFKSVNGVWLTKVVPVQYLEKQ